ncbi:hypothetical protein V2K57_07745 [Pseudomonas alliivorans]|nr:hypothetical protein [Pseudomonas alliivorans]MEE4736269.1 hypothetical protein [Pseudomonas alliivorans]
MLSVDEVLLGLGSEVRVLSAEIFKACQEVNDIYDRVSVLYDRLRVFQDEKSQESSMMLASTELSYNLLSDLEKMTVSMVQLDASVKNRLACYGVQLDLIRDKLKDLSDSQVGMNDAQFGMPLKDSLLRNIDVLCENISRFIRSETFPGLRRCS